MTDFANDATTAELEVLDPAVFGNGAGVDAIDDRHRARAEPSLHFADQGREAAVKPNQEQARGRAHSRADGVELIYVQRKGLLDEHMLASPQRVEHIARMSVVACGNENRGGLCVGDHRACVRTTESKAETF